MLIPRQQPIVPERLFVSSPAELSASPFARVAQAAHLLGKVIDHCNREIHDFTIVQGEVEILHKTITALLELLSGGPETAALFQDAIAICLRWASIYPMFFTYNP